MLIRPLGDIGRRLHHALHQRLLRNELQPLFVALARRVERAHRQNQLDHRAPVFKRNFSAPFIARLWHFDRATATLRLDGACEYPSQDRRKITASPRRIVRRVRRLAKRAKFRNVRDEFALSHERRRNRGEEARVERRSGHDGGATASGFSRSRRGSWPPVRIDRPRHRRVRDPRSSFAKRRALKFWARSASGARVSRAASPKALASIPARSSSSRTPFPRTPDLAPGLSWRWRSRRRFAGWRGLPLDAREDARLLDRGARSGVGVALFERGGLAVDAGRGPNTEVPPVVASVNFPRDWRILLILDPRVEGAHGEEERRAFAGLPRFPADAASEICRRTLMQILPGAAEADLEAFGDGVARIQEILGDHFAPVQGGGRFISVAGGPGRRAIEGSRGARDWPELLGTDRLRLCVRPRPRAIPCCGALAPRANRGWRSESAARGITAPRSAKKKTSQSANRSGGTMAKNILHMMTPLAHMSPFDVNMALDAGYDATASYTNVSLDEVTDLDPGRHVLALAARRGADRRLHRRQGRASRPRHARRRRQGAVQAVRDFAVRRSCRLVHHRRRDDRGCGKDAEGEEGSRASRRRRLGLRRDRRGGNRVGRYRRARGRIRHLGRARRNGSHGSPRRRGQSQVRRQPCRRRRLDAGERGPRSSRRRKSCSARRKRACACSTPPRSPARRNC